MRRILRLVAKDDTNDLLIKDINSLQFCPVKNEGKWKIEIIKELLDARSKLVILDTFDNYEIIKELIDARSKQVILNTFDNYEIIKELIDARSKQVILATFDNYEIINILDHVCISLLLFKYIKSYFWFEIIIILIN